MLNVPEISTNCAEITSFLFLLWGKKQPSFKGILMTLKVKNTGSGLLVDTPMVSIWKSYVTHFTNFGVHIAQNPIYILQLRGKK